MRHSLKLLTLFYITALSTHALAQTTLSGRVIDAYLQTPLKGVSITAGDQTALTGSDGKFQITVDAKTLDVSAYLAGYEWLSFFVQDWTGEKTLALKPSSMTLPEVMVRAYGMDQKLFETPGNLTLLTENDLNRGDRVNLAPVLNTVAGVRVDQAFMVDSRISLRGEGLRASYGIRNVGIYVDGIPLNEADGYARLEGLDPDILGEAQIIKGPASSLYGAGIGGDILFNTLRPPAGETILEGSGLVGSYGLYRAEGSIKADLGNASILLNYGNQWFDGYVNHTSDYHSFATALGTFYPSAKDSLTVLANQSNEQAEIASPETLAQFTNSPRAGVAADSVYNLHHNQLWTRFGVSNHYLFNDQWDNETTLYAASFTLDRAFADTVAYAAYLEKVMQNAGGRTQFSFKNSFGDLETHLSAGGEMMNQYSTFNYYFNNNGVPGAFGYIVQGTERHLNLFFQADANLEQKTFLSTGINYNTTNYILNLMTSHLNNEVDFSPTASLRVALSHVFDDTFSLYGDISQGFSPPAFDEMKNPFTGGLLPNLLPELATQYEIGARGRWLDKALDYDLCLYDLDATQELVQQTISGVAEYVNAAGTNHKGVELSISYRLVDNPNQFLKLVKPWVAYSYQHYVFTQYAYNGTDFSGKQLTGNPENQVNTGLDVETAPGFYLNSNLQFVDAYPITDGNTVWNNSYALLNAKVGFRNTFEKLIRVDAFVGGENLLNQVYSAYVAFNATNAAYYELGVGQSFFGGLNLDLLF